jgi:sporulation protein YlmC with PRC-barrel domain
MVRSVLSATTLIGDKVTNTNGENLGDIKDIMIDLESGCARYAVIDFGGFLGIADKYFAVPWRALNVDQKNECIVFDIEKERLENAPGFDKDNWPDMANDEWAKEVHAFYGVEPAGNPTPYSSNR